MTVGVDIVEAARSMLGTPFAHQGRAPGVGLDCIGLIVCSARACGIPVRDRTDYGRVPDGRTLVVELTAQMDPVEPEDALPGDILVFWVRPRSRHPQHVAIKTDAGMVHTYESAGRVCEHAITPKWARRLCGAFRPRRAA